LTEVVVTRRFAYRERDKHYHPFYRRKHLVEALRQLTYGVMYDGEFPPIIESIRIEYVPEDDEGVAEWQITLTGDKVFRL